MANVPLTHPPSQVDAAEMGHLILPNGEAKDVESVHGLVNLHTLIQDLKNPNYTIPYRLTIISTVSKLGECGWAALPTLEVVAANKDEPTLSHAAEEAVNKIKAMPSSSSSLKTSEFVSATSICPTAKRERNIIEITEIEEADTLDIGAKVFYRCNYCGKLAYANPWQRSNCIKLTGDNFYCTFCLRNDFYSTAGQHTYILTFRTLIGYYYYCFYAIPKVCAMPVQDLQDIIQLHFDMGCQHPAWKYDCETFCWFLDFSKIGENKIPFKSVLETLVEILAAFRLHEHVKGCSPYKFYLKYKEELEKFMADGTRPNGRILAPTLLGCDIPRYIENTATKALPIDVIKTFLPSNMLESNYWNRNRR